MHSEINEVRLCKACGEELPISHFRRVKGGGYGNTCKACYADARAVRKMGGGKSSPFSDPDFDGKSLREVMDVMSRAKRWLESRGCVINLSGEFHETKIRKLKFE